MKLSLIALAAATLTVACGTTEEGPPPAPPPAAEPASGEETDPPAPPRQLAFGRQLPTSAVNLITDPGFGLAGQQAGYGAFLAFYDATYERFEIDAKLDSRSPAGFGGAVAVIKPLGATDKKSDPVLLLTSFLGGKGPFHAQIWVSKSDVKGSPVDLPTEGAVTATVADSDPERGESFDLKPVPGATRITSGRTWVLLRADIAQPLVNGGFFLVRTGSKGGQIHLAAPEVTSDEIAVGRAVMAQGARAATVGRMKRASERAAIAKYRALPPRLVPAAPKPIPGL